MAETVYVPAYAINLGKRVWADLPAMTLGIREATRMVDEPERDPLVHQLRQRLVFMEEDLVGDGSEEAAAVAEVTPLLKSAMEWRASARSKTRAMNAWSGSQRGWPWRSDDPWRGCDGVAVAQIEAAWREDRQVRAELAILRSHKSRLMPGTKDRDHHAAIDAQIQVLMQQMSELQVIATWGHPNAAVNNRWFVAQKGIVASRWLHGPERHLYKRPTSCWDPYLIERRKALGDVQVDHLQACVGDLALKQSASWTATLRG